MKVEISDSLMENTIAGFLGQNQFQLFTTNVGYDKEYSTLYKKFKSSVSLPVKYVEKNCNSPYVKHFYSDYEVDEMRKKWIR